MKTTVSFIAILAIGAFVGNMLNIGLSHAIYWRSLNPNEFMSFFAIDFPLLLMPTAMTLLPAWLGSLFVFVKSEKNTQGRKYWALAFLGLTLTIIQTSVYHLPMNLKFMAESYDALTASNELTGWIISHWIRITVASISGVFAIKGLQQATIISQS